MKRRAAILIGNVRIGFSIEKLLGHFSKRWIRGRYVQCGFTLTVSMIDSGTEVGEKFNRSAVSATTQRFVSFIVFCCHGVGIPTSDYEHCVNRCMPRRNLPNIIRLNLFCQINLTSIGASSSSLRIVGSAPISIAFSTDFELSYKAPVNRQFLLLHLYR